MKIDLIEMHMASAHFPIGLLMSSALFDAAGRWFKRPEFRTTSYWIHLFGVLSGIGTLILGIVGNPFRESTGWLPLFWVHYRSPMANKMARHQWVGLLSLVLFAAMAYWRVRRKDEFTTGQAVGYWSVTFAAVGLIGLAGYLGAHVMD
jgi:uncharacterized membrane protein